MIGFHLPDTVRVTSDGTVDMVAVRLASEGHRVTLTRHERTVAVWAMHLAGYTRKEIVERLRLGDHKKVDRELDEHPQPLDLRGRPLEIDTRRAT